MKSRFTLTSSPVATRRRAASERAAAGEQQSRRRRRLTGFAAATAVVATFAGVFVARAQEARPGANGARFPRVHHDAQNTGRALNEPYQGVTQGNVGAFQTPQNRTGNFDVDGWGFPREAANALTPGTFVLRPYVLLDDTPAGTQPPQPPQVLGGFVTADAGWTTVAGPSVEAQNAAYTRILAKDRETDTVPDAFFTWQPTVPGTAGTITRLAVSVYIPSPPPNPDPAVPATQETRINDAEYIVTCQAGANAATIDVSVRASQEGGGWRTLTNAAGQVLFFPFLVPANGQPSPNAQVRLSSKTSNDLTATTYVIADAVRFVQQFDAIQATPTVTPRHGGRRLGGPARQPANGPAYQAGAFTGYDPTTNAIGIQANETPGDFSTLFQGPESFITPNTTPPARPTNNNLYGVGPVATPIFSQMQVIVARTEYVPDPSDPLGSIQVGAVYAFDWLTGAPVWRFPDRTYLPQGGVKNLETYVGAYGAGVRNGVANLRVGPGGTGPTGQPVRQPAIPGIGAIDKNGDGTIQDDEVFIVGSGINVARRTGQTTLRPGQPLDPAFRDEVLGTSSGALLSSVTIVPDAVVEGVVSIPLPNGTATNEGPGRYYSVGVDAMGLPTALPVVRPVAYVAANNGVVYAIDPYGNSDGRYFNPDPARPNPQATDVGNFRPGTTNVLWTFSAASGPQRRRGNGAGPVESEVEYNKRLKGEVPATQGFGTSAPTAAYNRPRNPVFSGDPQPAPINPLLDEQRLFVGNENGYLYALDSKAVNPPASALIPVPGALPIRKGDPDANAGNIPAELRWWFEARGAVTGTPAVSQSQLDAGANLGASRGVYFTTAEGRVYCTDWEGPVSKPAAAGNTPIRRNWDGVVGSDATRRLNDGWRFRNLQPARDSNLPGDSALSPTAGRSADDTDGTIRPRWAFPQRFVDVVGTDNKISDANAADSVPARDANGTTAATKLAAPVTLGAFSGSASLLEFSARRPNGTLANLHYVLVAANDQANEAPTTGKAYLLDMAGDRESVLTNPTRNAATRAVAQPFDQFALGGPVGTATPAWTYRFLYGSDTGKNNLTNLVPGDGPVPFLVTRAAEVVPSRRLMPTVFVGGVGRLFALDLDFDTAVFQRWPTDKNAIPGPKPRKANGDVQDDLIPPALTDDAVAALGTRTRPDAALTYADLTRPVFGRTYSLLGDDGGVISNLTVTGGPLQPRGAAPAAGLTTYPPLPTNDPGGYKNVTDPATGASRPTQVEQNILDPRTQDDPSGNPGDAPTPGTDELAVGFQYPALWVSTQSGQLHEISTNIEGEDRSTEADAFFNESSALGWAYTTDATRQNDQHVQLDRFIGPGGAGGVAIVSNVYFEGLDPDYRNLDPATGPYPPGQPPLKPRALAAADDATGDSGFPLDGNGLFYDPDGPNQEGTIRVPRELGAIDDNPPASRVTWVYSGGPDGVMYAFTPVRRGTGTGGVPGQRDGGFSGGLRQSPQLSGDPKVDIFDEEDFDALLAAAQGGGAIRPDRDGSLGAGGTTIRSRAAKGKNNFFEWGETIYIVAYDLNAVTGTTDPFYAGALATNTGPNSVTITVTNLLNGQPVLTRSASLQTKNGSNDPATYQGDNPRYFGRGGPTASPSIPFGLAFFAVRLDGSGPQQPQTPGRPLQVRVTQQILQKMFSPGGAVIGTRRMPLDGRGTGPNEAALRTYLLPQFMIANPFAVESFLTDTVGRRATVINGDGQKNVIGPFYNGLNGTAVDDTQKGRVITDRFTTNPNGTGANQTPTPGTEDPDKNDFSYSQALANGNLIARYDMRPYQNALPGNAPGTTLQRNRGRGQRVINDPDFYVPIASGTGYVGHGSTGSTDQTPTVRNLSVFNRSRLVGLPRVRVARDEMQWRFWPGLLPNADADDALNPRRQPTAMSFTGVINPLPWEEAPSETKPWKQGNAIASATGGDAGADANRSQDYPNVDRSQISANVGRAGGDPTAGPATLPFQGGSGAGQTFSRRGTPAVGLGINVKVPIHQPANLVANGSLTSTYIGPNPADSTGGAATAALASGVIGPVQLPRGIANRVIRAADASGNITATSPITLTPWGYTARLLVYVDSNGDGKFDRGTQNTVTAAGGVDPNNPDISRQSNIEEACREVEVWVGVPVDIRMKSVEEVVDLTAALGLPHGFGQQNGLLGYTGDGADPLGLGFGPPPLTLAYDNFFKTANVRNDGNVNLWNVRAARRAAVLDGSTFKERFLQMRSNLVDQKFHVAAFGRDPLVTTFGTDPITGNPYGPGGLIPNLVTSLDEPYDQNWNAAVLGAPNDYPAYYAGFSGRHTLHKARPGQQQGTLLSLPDSPDNAPVRPDRVFAPRVALSVPIGTPSGVYSSRIQFFEDHDTPDPRTSAGVADLLNPFGVRSYHPAPFLTTSGEIAPAGPLYGGRNDFHPGDATRPGGKAKIFPADLEGVWRPRGAVVNGTNPPVPQYLPATDPATTLKATVVESPLTGQTPDNRVNPLTGLLPSMDLFSLVDPQDGRASAAVAPAAFRSAFTGTLHVYFSRSASDGSILSPGDARPGQPLRLFRSRLNWDLGTGTWKAANFGTPLNPGAENTNTGRWFTAPQLVAPPPAAAPGLQNAAPFVLHEVTRDLATGKPTEENAVLYWVNTEVVPGGAPINRIVYAPVNNLTTGELGPARPFLNPERFDPSARRLGPRAVTMGGPSITSADQRNQLVVLYYGGAAGRSSLFYSTATDANHDGVPDNNAYGGPETPLPIPAAIASATDPMGIARFFPQGARTPGRENQQSQWALDVYYSGVSRANQNADVYMTRYRARAAGGNRIQLDAVPLPRIEGEMLQAPTREPVWVSQHVSWLRTPLRAGNPDLPVVRITYRGGAPATVLPGAGKNWQYDDASGQLFTSYTRIVGARTTLNVVYADTSAGTLRFRGEGIPTSADIVRLDYTPQTYRITQDSASDVAPVAFSDDTMLAPTTNNNTRNEVLRRPNDRPLPANRQWIVWQKGARADQPASLYYNTRRVGIDLRQVVNTPMLKDESIELTPRDPATGNQAFVNVSVTSGTGANIPCDVDFANGRIFFAASLDGVEVSPATATGIRIRVDVVQLNANGTISNRRTLNPTGRLALIDDTVTEETGANRGRLLSRTAVNEGQPSAFSDAFDGNAGLPNDQKRPGDPTLQPGRVWLFWTSPRTRTYDIYWQTLAPNFESFSLTGFGPTSP